MKTRFNKLEVNLIDADDVIIARMVTTDVGQKRLTILFNDLARQIVDASDKEWKKV